MRTVKTVALLILLSMGMCLPRLKAETVQFAHAIARTEGFYVANSKAARYHNPGNLRACGTYRRFRTNRAGWLALYQQLLKVRSGQSSVYSVDMTLSQFGRRYAAGNRAWARNVSQILHVEPSIKIAELLDVPLEPAVDLKEREIDLSDSQQ